VFSSYVNTPILASDIRRANPADATITFRLLINLPFDVSFRDEIWRMEYRDEHYVSHVILFRPHVPPQIARDVCRLGSEAANLHQLRVLGVETNREAKTIPLLNYIVSLGWAQWLPEPRDDRLFPSPNERPARGV